MNLEASPELEYWSTGVMDTQCTVFKPSGLRLGEPTPRRAQPCVHKDTFLLPITPVFPGPDLVFKGSSLFRGRRPLALTWITGVVAYNKPKRQGGGASQYAITLGGRQKDGSAKRLVISRGGRNYKTFLVGHFPHGSHKRETGGLRHQLLESYPSASSRHAERK